MADNKKKNNKKKNEKVKKTYSNPVKSPAGKIIVGILAFLMLTAGVASLVFAIIQYVLHG